MSYILEALKKSQQERELGQVPTLDANLVPNEPQAVRATPWGLAAVTLASLAVVIALYAALRGRPLVPVGEAPPAKGPVAQAAREGASAKPAATSQAPQPATVPQAPVESPAVGSTSVQQPAASQSGTTTTAAKEPTQVATEPPKPARAAPLIPPRPTLPPVPADIRADVEAFKEQIRLEQAGVQSAKAKAPAQHKAQMKPEDLRLPPDVEGRLPAFFMTVHVYDKDPAKRFVGINSLKTREGERTREGIGVDEILPDGAVLSFEGHKFFRHR
jgi:general secretion pathway protein B